MQLKLKKSAEKLQLDLRKAGVKPVEVDVAFVSDVSYSYQDEHEGGQTQLLLTRLLPWGMTLDPDRKMEMFTFSHGEANAHYVGQVDESNYSDFMRKRVISKVPGYGGNTDYSFVLSKVLYHFGWVAEMSSDRSFFGTVKDLLFGKSDISQRESKKVRPKKVLVLFNTDGDNDDKEETTHLLEEMENQGYEVYILFIAYANDGEKFKFLHKIANRFKNTGLHVVHDLNYFTRASDEYLNQILITPELVAWLNK